MHSDSRGFSLKERREFYSSIVSLYSLQPRQTSIMITPFNPRRGKLGFFSFDLKHMPLLKSLCFAIVFGKVMQRLYSLLWIQKQINYGENLLSPICPGNYKKLSTYLSPNLSGQGRLFWRMTQNYTGNLRKSPTTEQNVPSVCTTHMTFHHTAPTDIYYTTASTCQN